MKPALIFTCGLVTGTILTALAFCRKYVIVLPWHCPEEPRTPEESTNTTEAKDEGEPEEYSDSFAAPGEDSGNPSTDVRESGTPVPDSEMNDIETAEPLPQNAPEATIAEAVNQAAQPEIQRAETTAQPTDVPHAAVATSLQSAPQVPITETTVQQTHEAAASVTTGAAEGASA